MPIEEAERVAARQAEWLRERESEEQSDCVADRRDAGLSQTPPPNASTVGFWKITLAVFVGNLLTAIVAGFIYALAK
jgi:hypothetical protein